MAEELRKHRWVRGNLKQWRKTDAIKVKMAQRLCRETVMTLESIAERLQRGGHHTLANCLRAGRILQ